MSFLDLAKERYSVRKYSSKPVEQEKINAILEAATLAPTGCNKQPQRILLVDDPEKLAKIRLCTPCQFGAPLTFILCYEKGECWINPENEPIGDVDVSIVTAYMQLEAVEQGLGTCWVACFDRAKLQQELNIPANLHPVAVLPMGYPADDAAPSDRHFSRKPPEQFTWKNEY